jgi:putative membrane protein
MNISRTDISKSVLVAMALICAPVAIAQQPMQPSKATELMLSNSESDFMKAAASSGQFEVEAAKLAQSKSTDPALKNFADKMVTDHTQVNEKLIALAQQKNVPLPTTLREKDQKLLDDLNKAKAGKDFDDLYRKDMVKTHKEAVSLFDNASKHAKDADVKAFASSTLATLEQHGGLAESLKKSSS